MGKTILMCWELGGGYGHLATLVPIARTLTGRGHRVIAALKILDPQTQALRDAGAECVQAPVWTQTQAADAALNYSQLLLKVGYQKTALLNANLGLWRDLIQHHQPDLLVIDHAPTAQLAALSLDRPAVTLNTGFGTPPGTSPFPALQPGAGTGAELAAADRAALETINRALERVDARPLSRMAELFAHSENLLLTLPELDHYPQREGGDYWGPVLSTEEGQSFTWPGDEQTRIFAYLKPEFVGLPDLLEALQSLPCQVVVHISRIADELKAKFESPTLRFLSSPANIQQVIDQADVTVCHAGHGLSARLLMAGRKLVLIPLHIEQAMLAERLTRSGLAVSVYPENPNRDYRAALEFAGQDQTLARNLDHFRALYHGYDRSEQLAALADFIEELAGV